MRCLASPEALVNLFIKRTKDRPFSFQFHGGPYTRTVLSLHSFRILEILVAHADRWRSARLIIGKADELKLLTKAKYRFGQLHSVQISALGVPDHLIYSNLFQHAPNLTRVYLSHYYQLPWSSITVFHIRAQHTMGRFFAHLDKMTCLEELVIRGIPLLHDVTKIGPIELPSLKILSVEHYSPLSLIKTPALEKLYLADALVGGVPAAETLLCGVSHLQTLSFGVHSFDAARIIDCTPELDHLILSCNFAFFVAFQPLLESLVSRSTAHSLRRISIYVSNLQPSTYGLLTVVIKSWEKLQFPKLHLVSVHVDEHRIEIQKGAVADLVRVGADKGFGIDVGSDTFPTMVPFETW